jgi:ketosteroid isomerase-like protein
MTLVRYFWLTALFVWLPGCNTQQPTPDAPEPEARLEFDTQKHIDAWLELWNSYDLNLVENLFLTDENVSYFSSEKEGLIRGIEAVREHHRGFGFVEGGKPAENELWVEDVQSYVHGDAAIVTGIWYFGDRGEERDKTQHGPMTFVYVQKDGEFRLAHLSFGNYETDTTTE